MALTQAVSKENQARIEALVESFSAGKAATALFEMLNQKAPYLKMEQERLKVEEKQFLEALTPISVDSAWM